MTETLSRPASSPPPVPEAGPGPLRTGLGAALRAAVGGLLLIGLPVLVAWAMETRSGAAGGDVLRSVGQLWLLAHGVSLEVADGRFGLTPLGLCAVPLVLLFRAGRRVAEPDPSRSVRAGLRSALVIGVPYALLTALVAASSSTGVVRPSPTQALLGGAAIGVLGAGAGALRASRLDRAAWAALPARARRLGSGAGTVSAVLLAAGALLAGLSLAAHLGQAAELARVSDPGPVGGVTLLLLGLTLVPNAVIWAGSWLVGSGFALGVGTSISPFAHEVGAVPAFPLLAALPGGPTPGGLGVLALLVPVAAGALAGRQILRVLGATPTLARTIAETAALGPACGLVWALLAWLAGGPAGSARLSVLGPSPVQVGLAVAALVAVGAVAAALVLRHRAMTADAALGRAVDLTP